MTVVEWRGQDEEAFTRLVDRLWRIDITAAEWLLGLCVVCVVLFAVAAL